MRVVIKPAGLLILIVVIAVLASLAFFGLPRTPTAAVARTASPAKNANSAAGSDLLRGERWNLAVTVAEAAELKEHTGAVPGVGEPVTIHTIRLKKTVPNPWGISLHLPTPAAIVKGEKLKLTFRARSEDAAPFTANFEQNSAPHPKSGTLNVSTTREWNLYTMDFVSTDKYAPEASQTTFHVGMKTGTLEIADIRLRRVAK